MTRVAFIVACIVACFVGAVILPTRGIAAPFVPDSDDQILERLPTALVGDGARAARDRRQRLAADPNDVPLALETARAHVREARRTGDPRFLGYAEAALAPWWDVVDPPVPVLVVRATIRQSLHDFDGALADLGRALARDPRDAQAWLTQALIRQTRGDYAAARTSCDQVRAVAGRDGAARMVGVICGASVASFTGDAARSRVVLQQVVAGAGLPPDLQLWALGVLADVETRLGNGDAAVAHYRAALVLAPRDLAVRSAFADLLLDRGEPAAVLALVAEDLRIDALLLRATLAEQALGTSVWLAHRDDLQTRFAAAHLRNDTRQLREEARFALLVQHDAATALTLAERNWQAQREPEDARVLLGAALAAGNRAVADDVRQWLAQHRLEDARLATMATRASSVWGVGQGIALGGAP